ncbi:MAG: HNH endonuclease signature motif containing protein [Candidatus Bathyarchaeia archaeon]
MGVDKIECTCAVCGAKFKKWPSILKDGRGKYCSKDCYYKSLMTPAEDRFWQNVDKKGEDECWNWTGCFCTGNYGTLSVNKRQTRAHRYAWELHNGSIPEGLIVLHSCDNPACCNPNHLSVGTPKDNTQDMLCKNRRHDNKGTKNANAKLTENSVQAIRGLYKYSPRFTQAKLGELFGVALSVVNRVINYKIWKHVP